MKQIKFREAWGELEANNWFQRQYWPKYMRNFKTVQFLSFNSFSLVLTKCSFWEED